MKNLIFYLFFSGFIVFIACNNENKIDIVEKDSQVDLNKLIPQDEEFAAEPLLVYLRQKIESKNFEEFKNATLSSQPESKQKVIKMILDDIESLDYKKSLTGVYVEHSNNVTFSIVYFLFDNEENASKAIPKLEMLYTELIGQEFKQVEDKRILGDDQKVLYTMYQSIPIYLAFYRRDNIVVLLFVPTRSVFPRVFPISSIHFTMKNNYYVYQGLPDFAQIEKPTIPYLSVPTDDYYIPNTSALREMAEERSKLWMEYYAKYIQNAKEITQQFFALANKRLMDFALAYVDFRNSQKLIPQKFPEWHTNEIENKIGEVLKIELLSKNPMQPRYDKIHYEGGIRYQYPKLGFADLDFKLTGTKSSKKVRITFTTFGKYLKIVDMKFL